MTESERAILLSFDFLCWFCYVLFKVISIGLDWIINCFTIPVCLAYILEQYHADYLFDEIPNLIHLAHVLHSKVMFIGNFCRWSSNRSNYRRHYRADDGNWSLTRVWHWSNYRRHHRRPIDGAHSQWRAIFQGDLYLFWCESILFHWKKIIS